MDPGVIIKLHVETDEQTAAMATCPLCRNQFEIADDAPRALCPGCGLSFTPAPPKPDPAAEEDDQATSTTKTPLPADPLDRWLQGAPIQPREITETEWLRNWARRHWLTSGALGIGIVALAMVALTSFSAWLHASWRLRQAVVARETAEDLRLEAESSQAENSRELEQHISLWKKQHALRRQLEQRLATVTQAAERAEHARREAEEACRLAEREVRGAIAQQLAARSELIRAGHPEHSLLLAAEALNLTQRNGEAPITSAAQYLRDQLGADDGRYLRGHGGKITALAISRKSRWLATASIDNTTRLWGLKSDDAAAQPIVLAGHHGRVSAVSFSPDARWLATGRYDSTDCIWNLASTDPTKEPLVLRGHEGRITSLAISSNGRWLFAASSGYNRGESELRVWDLAASDPADASRVLPGHGDRVQAIAVSRDDRWLATVGDDGMVRLCSMTADGPSLRASVLSGHQGRLHLLSFSSDG